ncbi:MAG: hypothetical protein K9K67_12155 [Bacteriovoracaceae bacterium]|nr:hypothetical protein [Bacteriovoracaceae bacterium]
MKKITTFFILVIFSLSSLATNLKDSYLLELKNIKTIQKNGDNKLFSLLKNSSKELEKDWSPELAKELARVFNILLNVNQNYFLVELIQPVLNRKKKEFLPILDKALSKKNREEFKMMQKILKREESEGNK